MYTNHHTHGHNNDQSGTCRFIPETIETGDDDYARKNGLVNHQTLPSQPKVQSTQQHLGHQTMHTDIPYHEILTTNPHTQYMTGGVKTEKKKKKKEVKTVEESTQKKVTKVTSEEHHIDLNAGSNIESRFILPTQFMKPRILPPKENILGDIITIDRTISLTHGLDQYIKGIVVPIVPIQYAKSFAKWVLLKCGVDDTDTMGSIERHILSHIETAVQSISISKMLNTNKTDILATVTGFAGRKYYNDTPCTFDISHTKELKKCDIFLGRDGTNWHAENLDKKIDLALHLRNEDRHKQRMTYQSGDGDFQYTGVRITRDHPIHAIHSSGLFFGDEESRKLGFDKEYRDVDDQNYASLLSTCKNKMSSLPMHKDPSIHLHTQGEDQVFCDILSRTNGVVDSCDYKEFRNEEFSKVGCVQLHINARVKFAVHAALFDNLKI